MPLYFLVATALVVLLGCRPSMARPVHAYTQYGNVTGSTDGEAVHASATVFAGINIEGICP